jgi:hypothetical protein
MYIAGSSGEQGEAVLDCIYLYRRPDHPRGAQ